MSDLPAPLVPAECDLRGLDWMPLIGSRLFASAFYGLALDQPRAGMAAIKLWWKAWQQHPAASLPNDERILARFADFGSDLRGWRRARDVALHGFVLCSDGRLYHRVLAGEAVKAFAQRQKWKEKKRRQRENAHDTDATRQSSGRQPADMWLVAGGYAAGGAAEAEAANHLEKQQVSDNVPRDVPVTSPDDRTGQDGTKERDSVPFQGTAPSAPKRPRSQAPMLFPIQGGGGAQPEVDGRPEVTPAEAARQQLWSEGRRILAVLKPGIAHDAMGKVLGKWARDTGGDHAFVVQRLRDAESDLASSRILGDPMAWVSKLMQRGPGGSGQRGAQPVTAMQRVRELTAKIEREACAQ